MNQEEIKAVQNRLLHMAKIIANILEKNKIPYMLAYGTLLGAIRHKGFIPWDDDFDFYLFDNTYEKALSVLRNDLPSDLFLEYFDSEPLYFHAWAHIKDKYTEVEYKEFPQDGKYLHKGLCIDLFKAKLMPKEDVPSYLIKENLEYLNRRLSKNLITEEDYKKKIIVFEQNIKEISHEFINDKHKVFATPTFYRRKYLEIDDVMPLKKLPFEDYAFYCPNRPENLLTVIYGDFMELPPVEKRRNHYTKVVFFNK